MEKKTIEIIVGKKVEGPVDPSLVAPKQEIPAPAADVEGRYLYAEWIECPYDGEFYRFIIDSDRYKYYVCPGCDQMVQL